MMTEHTQTISLIINAVLSIVCVYFAINMCNYRNMYKIEKEKSIKYWESHKTLSDIIVLVKKHLE